MIGFIGLFDTSRDCTLQFTITHTHTSVYSHVFTSRCSVAASNGGLFPSSGFPKLFSASATSFSQQQFTTAEPQQFSYSLTNWLSNSVTHQPTNSAQLTLTNCPAYSISAWTAQKTLFLCCCLRPLPSNGRCLVVCFSVVVQQLVYIPQYEYI
jgi:hypothetical protein